MTTRHRLLVIPVLTLVAFAGLGLLTLIELRRKPSESTEDQKPAPALSARYSGENAELAERRRASREAITPKDFVAMVEMAAKDNKRSTQELLASFHALRARTPDCGDKLLSPLLTVWNKTKADSKANLLRVEEVLTHVMLVTTDAVVLSAEEHEQLFPMLESAIRRGSMLAPVIVLVMARVGADITRLEDLQGRVDNAQLKAQIEKVVAEMKRSSGKPA